MTTIDPFPQSSDGGALLEEWKVEVPPVGASECRCAARQSEGLASRWAMRSELGGRGPPGARLGKAKVREAWDCGDCTAIVGIFEIPKKRRKLPEIPGRRRVGDDRFIMHGDGVDEWRESGMTWPRRLTATCAARFRCRDYIPTISPHGS